MSFELPWWWNLVRAPFVMLVLSGEVITKLESMFRRSVTSQWCICFSINWVCWTCQHNCLFYFHEMFLLCTFLFDLKPFNSLMSGVASVNLTSCGSWRLYCAKPIPGPMLTFVNWTSLGIKKIVFLKKMPWKCLFNFFHFTQTWMWYISMA